VEEVSRGTGGTVVNCGGSNIGGTYVGVKVGKTCIRGGGDGTVGVCVSSGDLGIVDGACRRGSGRSVAP
jgi:hypothetical protein